LNIDFSRVENTGVVGDSSRDNPDLLTSSEESSTSMVHSSYIEAGVGVGGVQTITVELSDVGESGVTSCQHHSIARQRDGTR